MQRAGFTLLTVDVEDMQVSYPSIWELMEDLRDMGESGAVLGRRPFIKRDVLIAADAIYRGTVRLSIVYRHPDPLISPQNTELHGNPDGTVPATFQVIYLVSSDIPLSRSSFLTLLCQPRTDRLETRRLATKTSTERKWSDQPQGRSGKLAMEAVTKTIA
jgi:hypothetical protein